jgi:sulfur carrier protein ThiS adenylyltransferase
MRHIVVAGLGNTGSHLLPELARMPGIGQITLVDPDVYDEANLQVQNIIRDDIGKPKVLAQAEKLRRINPDLKVVTLEERVEDVPRWLVKCDLMVSCLDSKAGRQHVNEICARLRIPWIDCGILGSQNLARVNAYQSAPDAPCLECSWGPEEYATIEQGYLCGAAGAAFPTMASSALGALAASLTALEIAKLLAGDLATSVIGKQVVVDTRHHSLMVTAGRRNPRCLFDHRSWDIEPWHCRPDITTVGAALNTLGSLQLEGHRFVGELVCPGCGRQESSLRLNRPLARCATCDRRMVTPGFGARERLDSTLPEEYRALTLAQIGVRLADVVSAGGRHYRITEAS